MWRKRPRSRPPIPPCVLKRRPINIVSISNYMADPADPDLMRPAPTTRPTYRLHALAPTLSYPVKKPVPQATGGLSVKVQSAIRTLPDVLRYQCAAKSHADTSARSMRSKRHNAACKQQEIVVI
jgi:hypothetical protein